MINIIHFLQFLLIWVWTIHITDMKIDVPWLFLSESVACFFTPLCQLFTYYLRKECPRTNFLSLVFEKMGSKSCKALKFLRKKVFKLYIFIPTLPPLRNCQGNKTTAQLSWGKFCSIFSLRKKGTWYSSFTVRDFSGVAVFLFPQGVQCFKIFVHDALVSLSGLSLSSEESDMLYYPLLVISWNL